MAKEFNLPSPEFLLVGAVTFVGSMDTDLVVLGLKREGLSGYDEISLGDSMLLS